MFHRSGKTLFALFAFLLLVSVARSGHAQYLYVTTYGDNTVHQFSLTGTPIRSFSSGGLGPQGIAADASGNLYVCHQNDNTVHKFGPNGQDLGTIISTGLNEPQFLALDANSRLYVNNFRGYPGTNAGYVRKFAPDGTALVIIAHGANDSEGVTLDKNGNLYVTDGVSGGGADTVHWYASDGTDLGIFASGLSKPIGMKFGPDGNLYVVNQAAHNILKFSPTGVNLGVFASFGSDRLNELTFDTDGFWYVTLFDSGTIHKLTSTGIDTGPIVTTGLNGPIGIVFVPPPSATVSGTVTLAACNDPEQNITFYFRPKSGGASITRKQVLIKSGIGSGTFSLSGIPYGTYDIAIKAYSWLQQVIPGVAVTGDMTLMPVTLPAGDFNNDNMVDIADFGLLVNNYGSVGDP